MGTTRDGVVETMNGKQILAFATVLLVLSVAAVLLSVEFTKALVHVKEAPDTVQVYVRSHRDNVERTLAVSYEFLSKYEVRSYADMFINFAEETGVPWEMFAAIVRIESNFDPSQKSSKGAIGMAQVLESTGKATAKGMGIKFKEGVTLWNDALNMAIGFTYFNEGYQKHLSENGDTVAALQYAIRRYVAGPGAASNMPKQSKSFDGGMEVRQYVSEYKETIWQEYRKLHFTFKGVCAE